MGASDDAHQRRPTLRPFLQGTFMSARPSRIGRQPKSYMLAPSTIDRLTSLSDASGLSRGKLIDRAVESLAACQPCKGTGKRAPGQGTCPKCNGAGIVAV